MSEPFEQAEREFLAATGLDPDDLAHLVADAPPLPAAVQERIARGARRRLGLPATAPAADRSRARPRWPLAAAAAALVALVGATAIVGPPQVQASLQRIFSFVPGVGITELDRQTLVMVAPVQVEAGAATLVVTGLISDAAATRINLRFDGLPRQKPAEPQGGAVPTFTAALHLPDGTRLDSHTTTFFGGEGHLTGSLWFAPLPPDTTAVTLDLPPIYGMTEPAEATVAVADAARAALAPTHAGGWADWQNGVRIGAPHVALDGDGIVISLSAAAATPGARVQQVGLAALAPEVAAAPPTLVDAQGRAYPLLADQSQLYYSSTDPFSVVFAGPLAPAALPLTLVVPAVEVMLPGETGFQVPLRDLPIGTPLELKQTLTLAEHQLQVMQVTRLAADRFHLLLDLGPEQDGVQLHRVHIAPAARASAGTASGMSHQTDADPRSLAVEVHFTPRGSTLDLRLLQPVVRVSGPWQVQLPLAPASAAH